ncbi:MAG: hypothetical protein DRO87_04170 [Candidatus Thorarchaeota archaeon]|nr:MAG: hypothetical protein DRP09_13840 [Candidatus Thorarchaeota archaeon]RLI59010.1 MAG: hypothetical protein DRO87_04170 [Candidatus Thorarchaeota archaeon]
MSDGEPRPYRGSAILVITIIVVSGFIIAGRVPRQYSTSDLRVRVAIIDSGINIDAQLESRVVAQRSFINTSLGYPETDNSTLDSQPKGTLHGTLVAKIVADRAPDAAIVNARVVGPDDTATIQGIVAAIEWAVLDENCSVINLSLGFSPIYEGDVVGQTIAWAVSRGVTVVAAAGNDGQDGINTSSIESPAIYPEVIAVAAINELYAPYSFTARGPLRDRTVKPDIAASGSYTYGGRTVLGTSFAAPVVSGAAALIIDYCLEQGWKWTPGMIKSLLMASAQEIDVESWEIGVGVLDVATAVVYLDNARKVDGLPMLAALTPLTGPFSFERWFVNHTSTVTVSVFSSSNVTFTLSYRGDAAQWVSGPETVTLNQTGSFDIEVCVVSSESVESLEASVTLSAPDYLNMKTELAFDVIVPFRKVAFDFSHTPWSIDSIYGQFRELYHQLTKFGILVEELNRPSDIVYTSLLQYDAVFVMDPAAWGYVLENYTFTKICPLPYTQFELNAYRDYWNAGGSLLLIGMSNSSIYQTEANRLFSIFNLTLNDDHVPPLTITVNGIPSTAEIIDMEDHPVTSFIDSFDYNGCSLNYSGDAFELARTQVFWKDENDTIHARNVTVLVGLEGVHGGRLLATGSNFWLDNWALNKLYHSDDNLKLVLQAAYWLLRVL